MNGYEKKYTVGPGETDLFNLCRPSAVLMFLQDIATEHAGKIGMGRDELVDNFGVVWILARLQYQLDKPLRGMDSVTIKTWNRGLKGVMWYRDFVIYANGEEIGKAVTAWVMADVETHKIKRTPSMKELDAKTASSSPIGDVTLSKIALPDNLSPVFAKTIRYSDLDINSHLNNTKYADIACDAVGYENLNGQFLSQMQINYIKECRVGDSILLNVSDENSQHKLICGTSENDSKEIIFEADMIFSEI